MPSDSLNPAGLLIDLDGVLYVGDRLIPGAIELVQALRDRGLPHCFLTNTTTKAIATLHHKLTDLGFPVDQGSVLSAPEAARDYLTRQGHRRCHLLVNDEVRGDFDNIEQTTGQVDAVVLGDIGDAWTYHLLNTAFQEINAGAEFIALHRNRCWQTEQGLQLDIGAFVAGLEYVTGREATVIGKPNRAFFDAALARIGCRANQVVMIGDDIDSDIGAAQALGMQGILVRTGKYRAAYADASMIRPTRVVDSVADVGKVLGLNA